MCCLATHTLPYCLFFDLVTNGSDRPITSGNSGTSLLCAFLPAMSWEETACSLAASVNDQANGINNSQEDKPRFQPFIVATSVSQGSLLPAVFGVGCDAPMLAPSVPREVFVYFCLQLRAAACHSLIPLVISWAQWFLLLLACFTVGGPASDLDLLCLAQSTEELWRCMCLTAQKHHPFKQYMRTTHTHLFVELENTDLNL